VHPPPHDFELVIAPRFRTAAIILIAFLLALGAFIVGYRQVESWVRDQVRTERAALDQRHDDEQRAQSAKLAEHQLRLESLERAQAEIRGRLIEIDVNTKETRHLLEQHDSRWATRRGAQ
jgi:hypothetical protein